MSSVLPERIRKLLLASTLYLTAGLVLRAETDYLPAGGVFPVPGRISSWSGFVTKNAERRALFATRRDADQNRIVFVGDSITEGWHSLDGDFAGIGVPVANRGIGGDTTPNLVYRLEDDVLALHPRGLVILIGTNDLGEGTANQQIEANQREILARVRAAYPKIPVVWCLVMPRGSDTEFVGRIRDLNARIAAIAADDPLVTVCDTFAALARDDGSIRPDCFSPDRLHLNPEGYAAFRDAVLPIVEAWQLPVN